jgi:hypothetical protein
MSHSDYLIIEHSKNFTPIRRFNVALPDWPKSASHQNLSSLNGFRRRELSRAFIGDKRNSGVRYDVYFSDQCLGDFWCLVYGGSEAMIEIPAMKFESVFDFYAKIGFDHKRNIFMPGSAVVGA